MSIDLDKARSDLTMLESQLSSLKARIDELTTKRDELAIFLKLAETFKKDSHVAPSKDDKTKSSAKSDQSKKLKAKKLQTKTKVTTINAITGAKSSIKGKIIEACSEILKKGVPMRPLDLLPELEGMGIAISGSREEQLRKITVILSGAKDLFNSDRKHGWSLKPSLTK